MFLETSAKTGHSVEEAFLKCSKNILAKIETGELDPERIGSGIDFFICTSLTGNLVFRHSVWRESIKENRPIICNQKKSRL